MSEPALEREYRIHRPEEWEAMNSPVRIEITAIMEMIGTCSIAEIARHMGRKPDSLYHHVRRLQEVGLVLQDGFRKVGRQTEALFRLRAAAILVGFDATSPANRAHFGKVAATLLRMVQREFVAAVEAGDGLAMRGEGKNLWIRREVVRLSARNLAALNEHLQAMVGILDEARRDTTSPPHTVTLLMNPLLGRSGSIVGSGQKRETAKD